MKEEVKETTGRVHHGHNIARLRKSSGQKQSALAMAASMSQQTWSRYEQKREIDDEILIRMAKALQVPVQIIKEMEEEPMTLIIENNEFHDNTGNVAGGFVGDQINSHTDEIIQLQKEIKELHERLLKAEQEKNVYLEKLVKKYEEG